MPEPTELYNYTLPEELIAQTPLEDRSASKLLLLNSATGNISHLCFKEITDLALPGDLWIFNDTKVFPARIFLEKENGTNIELLFLEQTGKTGNNWRALAKPGKRLSAGAGLFTKDTREKICSVIAKHDGGVIEVELEPGTRLIETLDARGTMPLPPYIKAPLASPERYQTVYSREADSSAAPTAGLHFTGEIFTKLKELADVKFVTLRIGVDTFKPIKTEALEDHAMHSESVTIPDATAEAVIKTKERGGRVVAVGTTAVRALESWAVDCGSVANLASSDFPREFRTSLFIRPGFNFKIIDALLTNFHLPKSTLLVLVSAFAGRDNALAAYRQAAELKYRFYSFGDAMFIV